MKRLSVFFLFSLWLFVGCNKNDTLPEPKITSTEYDGDFLYTTGSQYRIETSEPATFRALGTNSGFQISADGTIMRGNAGTINPVEISWTGRPGQPKTLYVFITDKPEPYRKGWQTLKTLAASGQTMAIVLRHADADVGVDKPELPDESDWWKSCDAAVARQLNDTGRQRAAELGQTFKTLGLPIARVLSSEFCRCRQTAELLNLGLPVKTETSITFTYTTPPTYYLFRGLAELAQTLPDDKKQTVIVAHGSVTDWTSNSTFPVEGLPYNWSDSFLVSMVDKKWEYKGLVPYNMWLHFRMLKTGK